LTPKLLILCIDAFGPDYLEGSDTPAMDRMIQEGCFAVGRSVIPSVTNVNNVSIITGAPPRAHGITANCFLDESNGEENYMESPELLCCPTVLQRAKAKGLSTALLTSKKKLLRLLKVGTDYALAAEEPDAETVAALGPAPHIYSGEINVWLFKALRRILNEHNPEVVYFATTDYMMHKHVPDSEESRQHIHALDAVLGEILDDHPDLEIHLTADHGMSPKTRGIDVARVLRRQGIAARMLPIIKDRYVAHHQNLGGACYVYLDRKDQLADALAILGETPGVEETYAREEAAAVFDLMARRIGDIMILGDRETVFGEFESETVCVNIRSHGSRYESHVPIIRRKPGALTDNDPNWRTPALP